MDICTPVVTYCNQSVQEHSACCFFAYTICANEYTFVPFASQFSLVPDFSSRTTFVVSGASSRMSLVPSNEQHVSAALSDVRSSSITATSLTRLVLVIWSSLVSVLIILHLRNLTEMLCIVFIIRVVHNFHGCKKL